jgi:hypothetical protein
MNLFILVIVWLAVPVGWYALITCRLRRLRREREHDQILYALCAARANIIHQDRTYPIGFAHIAKALDAQKNKPKPAKILQLLRELKRSDEETKLMVRSYIDAVQLIMRQDSLIVLLDKLCQCFRDQREFLHFMAACWLLSNPQRSFTRFNSRLADVVDYDSDQCWAARPALSRA